MPLAGWYALPAGQLCIIPYLFSVIPLFSLFLHLFGKNYMRIITSFRQLTLALAVLLAGGATQQALAQTPGTGGPTPQDPTPTPTEVPIDGGASLLLAGSVAYGLRKLRQRRRA
jgi:hypothetical protein